MLAGLAFGSEIKRFGRSRMTRVAIVVLMLLPLVYGALYLWAFWDPFGHVNKMPVALVNSDRGAVVCHAPLRAHANGKRQAMTVAVEALPSRAGVEPSRVP